MKAKTLFIFLFIPMLTFGQRLLVDPLLHRADSILQECRKLKPKDKSNTYEAIIAIHDSVYNLMADSVRYFSGFENDARLYRFFTCCDTSVFSDKYIEIDTLKLPKYMQEHYAAISAVRELVQHIKEMEEIAKATEANSDITAARKKANININTETRISKANESINIINMFRASSFSEEQDKFYQNIITRLNNFLEKYIFDYEE